MTRSAQLRLALPITLLLGAGCTATARADDAASTVSLSGIDLATPAGQAIAERRLGRAADRVCIADQGDTLSDHDAFEACRDQTLEMAKADLRRRVMVARSGDGYRVADSGR